MQHLDEGTIHAWLDGALPPEEGRSIEAHIAECDACARAVTEARGLIAASSRILSALDALPGGVIPALPEPADDAPARRGAAARAPRRWLPPYARIAAAVVFVAAGAIAVTRSMSERGAEPTVSPSSVSNSGRQRAVAAPAVAAPTAPPRAPAPPQRELPRTEQQAAAARPGGASKGAAAREADLPRLPRAKASANVATLEERGARGGAGEPPSADQMRPRPEAAEQRRSMRAAFTDSAGLSPPRAQPAIPASTDSVTPQGSFAPDRAARVSGAPPAPVTLGDTDAVGERSALDSVAKGPAAGPVTLRLMRVDTVTREGRVVQRKVYEVRPGVRVTLDVAALAAERQAPFAARVRPERSRADEQMSVGAGMNSIQWTDSAGTEFTLTGRLSIEELKRLKPLVH